MAPTIDRILCYPVHPVIVSENSSPNLRIRPLSAPLDELNQMMQDADELIRILTAIVKTGQTAK
jgi:hypothetical protein